MDILIKAGQLILSLSILVVLHELGHFTFAKIFKTRVEKFYLFFNPWFSLFKHKKGETEYGIGWLPLGGYVKIAGMIDESMDKEQLKQPPQPYEFRSKPAWQRLLIMVGGVLVNFITAIAIFWMLIFTYGESYMPITNAVYGLHYTEMAREIGLRDGDIVIKADNFEIKNPTDIAKYIMIDDVKRLTVKRGDSTLVLDVPDGYGQRLIGAGIKGFAEYRVPFVIDSVVPNMPAYNVGIQKGDSLLTVNGEPASYYHEFVSLLSSNKGKYVLIEVMRDTSVVRFECRVTDEGKIGIGNRSLAHYFKIETIHYSFWGALPAGIDRGFTILFDYVKQLKKIFTREGVKQIGGFGTIGSLFPSTWDWASFWSLTAILSVILAFMNILPIPALDGGHVIFLLFEMITGRKPSEKVMEYAQIAGMIILLTLLLYANTNDIFKFFR
jgi:regulator of sigma E protease